jgi:hypothetical protein
MTDLSLRERIRIWVNGDERSRSHEDEAGGLRSGGRRIGPDIAWREGIRESIVEIFAADSTVVNDRPESVFCVSRERTEGVVCSEPFRGPSAR